MGRFIYASLWIIVVGLDIVFLLTQVLAVADAVWVPSFEPLVIFNLLVAVLGPPEEN